MDPFTIAMFAILAVLIFFMFRNSRKRKADLEALQAQIVPGAEIMTNFGMFGTLKSLDEITNVAEVETSPGTIVRIHRQSIGRIVTDEPRSVEEAQALADAELARRDQEAVSPTDTESDPEFGERVGPAAKKPARRTTKKAAE